MTSDEISVLIQNIFDFYKSKRDGPIVSYKSVKVTSSGSDKKIISFGPTDNCEDVDLFTHLSHAKELEVLLLTQTKTNIHLWTDEEINIIYDLCDGILQTIAIVCVLTNNHSYLNTLGIQDTTTKKGKTNG